jgi:hypothetical protein
MIDELFVNLTVAEQGMIGGGEWCQCVGDGYCQPLICSKFVGVTSVEFIFFQQL